MTPEERKATPVFRGVMAYFPKAIREISRVSYQGSKQHHPDKPMFWDRTKSTDHLDCIMRHLLDSIETEFDTDGVRHAAKAAWRALAHLEVLLETSSGDGVKDKSAHTK